MSLSGAHLPSLSADKTVSSALQSAINALSIEDVSFRSVSSWLAEGFEPKFDPDVKDLQVDLRHFVAGYEIVEVQNQPDENGRQLFRVLVDLGVRWSRPTTSRDRAGQPHDEATADPEQLALIEALMVAEYAMATRLDDEALEAFALQNASFHVWPYWREYVCSQCYRLNLPRFLLPTRQFAQTWADDEE